LKQAKVDCCITVKARMRFPIIVIENNTLYVFEKKIEWFRFSFAMFVRPMLSIGLVT